MSPDDYEYLCALLMETSGLDLGASRQYLVDTRLTPLAKSCDLPDLAALVVRLKAGDQRLRTAVTEAMTTNETSFFRDTTPFDALRTMIVPQLMAERAVSRTLRIWCAATSTGQEPYSVAIMLREHFPELSGWRVEFVGTDISNEMVDRCRKGVFSQLEVQRGLPIQLLVKYFEQVPEGWQIKRELRDGITFRQMNLTQPFHGLGTYDIVLCRNVLIYFNIETKGDVLDRIARTMRQDAFLLLGSAETVIGICDAYERVEGSATAVYRRKGVTAATGR